MKKIQYSFFILFFLFSTNTSFAQVPKNIMVEHFTNTRCGICSSRNPQFYQNRDDQNNPNIFHIAYHPSSPYGNCQFSLHNPSENDDRTNFYNNYGSTPKLVLQGEKLPNNIGFGDAAMFTNYLNQTTPIGIDIDQVKSATSIDVTVHITAEEAHNLGALSLYVGVAEDTVFYAAPNGEPEHYDVFRKAFTASEGDAFTPSTVVGTTDAVSFSTPVLADWDLSRMYTFVILQDPTSKEIIQSQVIAPSAASTIITSLDEVNTLAGLSVFPNPNKGFTTIQLQSEKETKARVFNLLGELVLEKDFSRKIELNISSLAAGTYFLELENEEGRAVRKLIKE